jgi:hypothetical protein
MFGPFGERLSCARSALGKGGAGAPYRAQNFLLLFFFTQIGGEIATHARVALRRRVRAWAKHREMLISLSVGQRPMGEVWSTSERTTPLRLRPAWDTPNP